MTPTEEQFQEIKELVYTDIIQNKIENYKTGNLTRTEFIDIFDVHIRRRLNLPENEEIIMNFPQCHALHKLCIGIAGEYWRQAYAPIQKEGDFIQSIQQDSSGNVNVEVVHLYATNVGIYTFDIVY